MREDANAVMNEARKGKHANEQVKNTFDKRIALIK